MNTLNVLFINRFFHPDHSATSQMLSDLAFTLAERGHVVKVIASRLTYDSSQVSLPEREITRNVAILRIGSTAFGRGTLPGRTLDYLTFCGSAAWALARRLRRGDVVVVKTDPPMLSIVVAPIAWMKGARCVNWLQDVFPEVATTLGVGQGWALRLILLGLRKVRDATLRTAALNVVLGEGMAKVTHRAGAPEERICVIPNWADGRLVCPLDRQENLLRREWGLIDAFVIGYCGNLGRAHEIGTILAAAESLERQEALDAEAFLADEGRDRGSPMEAGPRSEASLQRPLRWLFVGGGARMEALKRETVKRGLKSFVFRGYQSRERLSETLSAPDVHLVSLRPSLEGLIVPSKYYGVAASARPAIFIGDPDGEIARLITQNDTGFVVAEGDNGGLARAIVTLLGDPVLAAEQGMRARRLFEERFDLPLAVAAWEKALRNVSRQPDHRRWRPGSGGGAWR